MTIISLDILSYLTLGFVEKDERKLLALCSTVYLIFSNLSLDSEILNVFPSEIQIRGQHGKGQLNWIL